MSKVNQDDALYAIRKTAKEDALKAAQMDGRANFEYADKEQVKEVSDKMIALFKPTLTELKYR